MIGIYLRVSSYAQKSDSQRAEIQQWLDLHGYDPDTVLWFEDQETGVTLKRASFQQLQSAIFRGEIKTVVVWKLDRLARSMREGVSVLTDWCERGVRIVSVTQYP